MRTLLCLVIIGFTSTAMASDVCVTGLKGTIAQAFIFKVSQNRDQERTLSVLNVNRDLIFQSKADNRFVKFNSSGYGTCSVAGMGTDDSTGAQYKVELKTSTHSQKECETTTIPTRIEFLSLKINPKGTTLGDDLTSYALTAIPCP
jgi:hypothetical protein